LTSGHLHETFGPTSDAGGNAVMLALCGFLLCVCFLSVFVTARCCLNRLEHTTDASAIMHGRGGDTSPSLTIEAGDYTRLDRPCVYSVSVRMYIGMLIHTVILTSRYLRPPTPTGSPPPAST